MTRTLIEKKLQPKHLQVNAGGPPSADELQKIDAHWRACNSLAAGMICLQDNPSLREPLKAEHVKARLLERWDASPGLSFICIHLNRLINKLDLRAIFLAGPGNGPMAIPGAAKR